MTGYPGPSCPHHNLNTEDTAEVHHNRIKEAGRERMLRADTASTAACAAALTEQRDASDAVLRGLRGRLRTHSVLHLR